MVSFSLRELCQASELKELILKLEKKGPLLIPFVTPLKAKIVHPEFDHRIYVPENSTESSSSLVIQKNVAPTLIPSKQSINIFWEPELLTEDDLVKFLLNVPEWDWKMPFVLGYADSSLLSKLTDILRRNSNLTGNSLEAVPLKASLWTLDEKDIKELKVPSGYKIGALLPHHMEYISASWPYGELFDSEFLMDEKKRLTSTAIFEEIADVSTDNPVSFVMEYPFGEMGLCYTEESHRRKGLASVVEMELAKKLMAEHCNVMITISKNNIMSEKLHEKVGFKTKILHGQWIYFVQGPRPELYGRLNPY